MRYLDIVKQIEQTPPGSVSDAAANEKSGPPVAVKIGGSVIGDFWIVLCDQEPFDPGDGLPIYRPSEMKAMLGKGYGPDALQAVHLIKTAFDGKMVS